MKRPGAWGGFHYTLKLFFTNKHTNTWQQADRVTAALTPSLKLFSLTMEAEDWEVLLEKNSALDLDL